MTYRKGGANADRCFSTNFAIRAGKTAPNGFNGIACVGKTNPRPRLFVGGMLRRSA